MVNQLVIQRLILFDYKWFLVVAQTCRSNAFQAHNFMMLTFHLELKDRLLIYF